MIEALDPLAKLILEEGAAIEAGKRSWVRGTGASRYYLDWAGENDAARARSDLLRQPRIGRGAWDRLPSAFGGTAGMYRRYNGTVVYAAGTKVRRAVEMVSVKNRPRRGEKC